VRNLTVEFPGEGDPLRPVDGVSFDVGRGEIVGLVGESGSGKSLTALAVACLAPYPGRVRADSLRLSGEELLTLAPDRRRRLLGTRLAMVFQDPMSSLNPALRVGIQLIEGAQTHRHIGRAEAMLEARDRLASVHIAGADQRLRQYPHEFSGGMRQRVTIAMGLMNQPDLIIADEPTTALDVTVQAQIVQVLEQINREAGTAILLISHDLALVSQVCSRALVMYAGRVVEEGPIGVLLDSPAHPYTRALMAAVPDLRKDRQTPLETIAGRPPDLGDLPPGCAFAPRCPIAVERSREEAPALDAVGPGHRVACWVAQEEARRP